MDSRAGPSSSNFRDLRPLTEKELQAEVDKLMDEEIDDEILPAETDSEEDHVSISDHNTNTDQDESEKNSSSDESNSSDSSLGNFYLGKDGTRWSKETPPKRVRRRAHNIVTHLPGPKGKARSAMDPFVAWNCMITDVIINVIVKYTNIYMDSVREQFARERDATPTNIREIKSLFGLLYYAGVLRSGRLNTKELWEKDGCGVDVFPACMSRKRFLFLLSCLRFDDIRDRETRRQTDKLAAIREISTLFQTNIQNSYVISEYATIDEKLEPFRGRCSFRQYIKSKPARYGIKIFLLCDRRTYYTNNFEVYVGKQPEGEYRLQQDPYSVVCRLIKPIDKTGRNITMDNWFMSMKLMNDLLANHRLTCVGTIRKNKREVPPQLVCPKNRTQYSSIFAFSENNTLVSYCPKKGKTVLLGSTMHHDDSVDSESAEKKPEMIMFYNVTKGGVDTVDQLCGSYSVSRRSLRWPLTIFFGFLNIAAINAYVIYKSNKQEYIFRRTFLKNLAKELIQEQLEYRSTIVTLPTDIKTRLRLLVPKEDEDSSPKRQKISGRCQVCPSRKDRKTKTSCSGCYKLICREHCVPICQDCFKNKLETVQEESE